MADSKPSDAVPTSDLEEIPVEELIRLTRAFTRRVTNQDRQRLSLELRESGHTGALLVDAPVILRRFFAGEIDLDIDLARRFPHAPLMSHVQITSRPDRPLRRQVTAMFHTNDESAALLVDAQPGNLAELAFTFVLFGALGMRFELTSIAEADRRRWLDLMRRESGITFLWTQARWEQPYLILVVREGFGRLYAYAPHGIEAAARLTPDMVTALADWLEAVWFPAGRQPRPDRQSAPRGADRPTLGRRPARRRPSLRELIPDAPEEQWDDESAPVPPEAPPDVDEQDLSPDDLAW